MVVLDKRPLLTVRIVKLCPEQKPLFERDVTD